MSPNLYGSALRTSVKSTEPSSKGSVALFRQIDDIEIAARLGAQPAMDQRDHHRSGRHVGLSIRHILGPREYRHPIALLPGAREQKQAG